MIDEASGRQTVSAVSRLAGRILFGRVSALMLMGAWLVLVMPSPSSAAPMDSSSAVTDVTAEISGPAPAAAGRYAFTVGLSSTTAMSSAAGSYVTIQFPSNTFLCSGCTSFTITDDTSGQLVA